MSPGEKNPAVPNAPMATRPKPVIACYECDLLQREVELPSGGAARCRRCGALLYRSIPNGPDRTVAFLLAAAIVYLIANIYPIVGLEAQGIRTTTTLIGAVKALQDQGLTIVAGMVFITAIVAPVMEIGALLYLLLPLKFGRVPAGFNAILRTSQEVKHWNMVEVFMLGVLVALVKLAKIASVTPALALWMFAGLTLLLAAAWASFDPHDIRIRAERIALTETEP
ncbi:MAG: paraquat-inducible protein A [Geobacteraceae bacterium]